ncbi:MAG: hypothetical protein AABW92_00575, partial [Nanoarchaeota archaeon]
MSNQEIYYYIASAQKSFEGYNAIVFSSTECQKFYIESIRDIFTHTLFYRVPDANEIDLLTNMFESYIRRDDTFAVRVNGEYSKLEEKLAEKETKELIEGVFGYEIIYSTEAGDG